MNGSVVSSLGTSEAWLIKPGRSTPAVRRAWRSSLCLPIEKYLVLYEGPVSPTALPSALLAAMAEVAGQGVAIAAVYQGRQEADFIRLAKNAGVAAIVRHEPAASTADPYLDAVDAVAIGSALRKPVFGRDPVTWTDAFCFLRVGNPSALAGAIEYWLGLVTVDEPELAVVGVSA